VRRSATTLERRARVYGPNRLPGPGNPCTVSAISKSSLLRAGRFILVATGLAAPILREGTEQTLSETHCWHTAPALARRALRRRKRTPSRSLAGVSNKAPPKFGSMPTAATFLAS